MIIWGSRGRTSVVHSQPFHCPQCSMERHADLKQVQNYFTLYFIPLIPLNVAGRYVECTSCGGTFAEEALTRDPEKERQEINEQLLRIMVTAALADGQVDNNETAEIKKQYMELAGLPVTAEKLQQEINLAISANATLNGYVATLVDGLSPHGRALVVKLAFHTMSASGDLAPGHQAELSQLQATLGIPEDQYRELIAQFSEEAA